MVDVGLEIGGEIEASLGEDELPASFRMVATAGYRRWVVETAAAEME
ncbi:hypothetical protein CASFOL_026063 [Castilleja foliolosa]|uniref:Uncharacterized protein n=1 Tax=Castilleja foliolosa TaxID=1961234 RepID=A0ABD3CVG1_9LAMI